MSNVRVISRERDAFVARLSELWNEQTVLPDGTKKFAYTTGSIQLGKSNGRKICYILFQEGWRAEKQERAGFIGPRELMAPNKNIIVGIFTRESEKHKSDNELKNQPKFISRDGASKNSRLRGKRELEIAKDITKPNTQQPRPTAHATLPSLNSLSYIGTAEDVPLAAPSQTPVAVSYRRTKIISCCWPLGEPGTRSFRYCDDESEPGKPYCPDHSKLAHVKVRDQRHDAS